LTLLFLDLMQWCDATASKILKKHAGGADLDDRFTRVETAPNGERRTIVVGAGKNGYLLAGIVRHGSRATPEWAGVILVSAEGLMLTFVVGDHDIRCGAASDRYGFDGFRVEEILTLHNPLPFGG
jgi:hypothetical protein